MRFNSFRKLLVLLPILVSTFFAMGQDSTFVYLFDGGNGSPCAPASVNFYPTFNNATPTAYTWQVNGITFSTQEEPIRIFPAGGTFNVCLEATFGTDSTNTHCEEITIFDPPTVTLDNDVALGCSPLPVNFTLTSTTKIDSVVWDLGDGTVVNQNGNDSLIMIYEHLYLNPGTFSPIVTAFDENGCKVTVTSQDAVQVVDTPTPVFSADASIGCTVPHTVNFSNNTAAGSDLIYEWNFGVDASSTSTDLNPSYTYTDLGAYDVQLVVTNTTTSCSDTLLLEDFISIGEFNGFQYEIVDSSNCSAKEVGFSFYDSGNIQSVTWDFGDGNTSNQINPIHAYTTLGCFTPTLNIVTTDGCTYNATAPDCIQSNGPTSVNYIASGDLKTCNPVAGTTISFVGVSPLAVSWAWDFGGIGTSTEKNPTFTFTGFGYYPVTLTVTFADGCTKSVSKTNIEIIPIEAVFNSNVVDGCKELQVFFYDQTDGFDPIVSYEWDFDGGVGLNNIQNPVVVFADTGAYDITMMIETVSGCRDTVTYEEYIEVGIQSGPGFSADPLISCLEDEIQFEDMSGPLTDEWEWYFGDGGQSGEEDPQHEYTDTGFMDVTLITYFHGCPDTLLVEEYIYINAPKAGFSFEQDCSSPGEITFTDESAGAETWTWDFGDGTTSNVPSPAHTYVGNGSYLVVQTVFNSQTGCTHEEAMTVNVTSSAPAFTLSALDICVGDTISVVNSSIGASCYTWSFPFGVGMITNSFCDSDPQFYFPSPGCYFGFSLTITDGTNCTNTYFFPDTVCVSGSVSDFAVDDAQGCAPHTANFNNSAFGINGNIVNYLWEFGDSTTSTDANPTHVYTEVGLYNVSLTVENEAGCSDQLIVDSMIIVDKIEPFFIPQITDCSSQAVDFTNATTSYDNNLTYVWDFGDGNTSTEMSPTHSYTAAGTYAVCLTATNAWNCTEQFCSDVNFQPLTVDFVADNVYKSCPEPPLVSNFSDLSVNSISWTWNFGDGAISNLQNPSHSYNVKGKYNVCLTVTNVLGCSATECKTEYIEVDGPNGSLTVTPTSGCADLEVQFVVESENAYKYIWDFGDGYVIDSLANGDSDTISYTYRNAGTYTPIVLIEDASGCQIPVIGSSVLVEDIISDFSSSIGEVCEGAQTPIDFAVSFADPSSVISVNWEFPGSSTPTATGLNPTGIIYDQPGYYSVILNANTTFCQTTITKDSFVYVHPAPVTGFIVSPTTACNMETIYFKDTSSVEGDSIVAWNWTVDGSTYTDSTFSHEFNNVGTFNITLETTSGFGCVSTSQQSVVISGSPEVDAGEDEFLCAGEFVNLQTTVQTTDQVSYTWTPAAGLSCTDCAAPSANPVSTTMYYVSATSVNGCVSSDSVLVEVSVLPELAIDITPDTTICEGGIIQLVATNNHGSTNYAWDATQAGLSCYDCPNPVANPSMATTYEVTVVTDEGCTSTNSVTVDIITLPNLLEGEPSICLGESTELEVLAGTNISWSPANGLSCTDCPNPIASPLVTTTYMVTALVNNQCTVTDEITVSVVTQDDVTAGEDFTTCAGIPTTINGSYPAGNSTWSLNGDVIATNTPTPSVILQQSGFYILEVTLGTCVLSDTVKIEVRDKVEIYIEDVEICEGEIAQLEVTGDASNVVWVNSPGISDPTSATPTVSPTETTTYTVIGEYGQCESDTQLVTVTVLPLADISLPPIIYYSEGDEVNLDAGVTNPDDFTYSWSPPANLSCTDCADPIATPEEDFTYHVEATNALGCVDSASVFLRKIFICNEDLVIVPNAFTPNGDGNNDNFNIYSKLEIGMVRIYNRWGEVVFENDGGTIGWDGTFKGQKLNRDVFVYYIEATCEFNGKTIVKTGDVTLIR